MRWLGGKHKLAALVVANMPEHHCYCEPFAGACHVFFAKKPSPVEIINDVNAELVNFWRVLGRDAGGLMELGRACLYSRAEFVRLARQNPAELGDVERAWRFYYLNRACFGGDPKTSQDFSGATFGASRTENRGRLLSRALAKLPGFHARLANAVIERLDWADCIERYDSPSTCFYIDPPYAGCETDYGKGIWKREDYARLAERLCRISGSFLLSINDTPEMAETFAAFRVVARPSLNYSVNRHRPTRARELLLARP